MSGTISIKEILGKVDLKTLSEEHQHNLEDLLERINKIRASYGRSMTVTSGYRSLEDHMRIYAKKPPGTNIPMKSQHLKGAAVDISDPKKELQAWCLKNEKVLADTKLWCEDFTATPTWVHFQIHPPKSKARFFKP